MPAQSKERQCLVTRELLPVSEMVRFVIGPENRVVPDVAAKLPGRGLWIKASRPLVEDAAKKQLFAKAAQKPAKADAALADQTGALLHKRALEFLSLCRRSGRVVTGFEKVKAKLEDGKVAALIHASDAGDDGKRKLGKLVENAVLIERFSREELAGVAGSDNPVHLVLLPGGATDAFLAECRRLAGFE